MTAPLWVTGPLAAMMACGLATFLLAGRVPARALGAIGLVGVLIGFFALFVLVTPEAAGTDWRGIAVLFGSAAVFKLMNRFESAR